ncbi:hypothetical protein POTOM_009704 [Populus tomentosa]|uniref:Ribonucleotide reductase large subunit C-terminal domain-containing protein n=1 Tax=Populus tomentosa TaxID=118781 RepID=A0A8X8ACG8_POPTO|nr:hypothetical protein POTOM_009704 [Populus tomentosa]
MPVNLVKVQHYENLAKSAGGFGIASAVHNNLPTGSSIRGEDGPSNGFVPTLRVFNHTDRYLIKEEGRGKEKPWKVDVRYLTGLNIVALKSSAVILVLVGEERRAQDLFCALRIPDLFMERVRGDGSWSLWAAICENKVGLTHNSPGQSTALKHATGYANDWIA